MKKYYCRQPYHSYIEIEVEAVDEEMAEKIANIQYIIDDEDYYEKQLSMNMVRNGSMEIEEIKE